MMHYEGKIGFVGDKVKRVKGRKCELLGKEI